jgi:hypothetical protein
MSDFLTRVAQDASPEAREVKIGGETGTVYFRKITAGQREKILEGLKVSHKPGTGGTVEIDLAKNEHQRHLLVLFSVVHEDGRPFFKNLDAVRAWPAAAVSTLAGHAEAVNREDEDDLGKS